MAFIKVNGVALRGISACVPATTVANKNLHCFQNQKDANQVIEAIGIEQRHVATSNETASDLCLAAAKRLLEELGWEKESIDIIAFCTQCPDYINLPNSFVIHEKLGFPESTICLDFYHGCPGWVVSLCSVANMLSRSGLKRALLLDGDTISKIQYAKDRERLPLFGDAGTATALEFDENATPMYFNIGTVSGEGKTLTRQNGGYRNPWTVESLQHELDMRAGLASDFELTGMMDGMGVFSFAITKVPKSLKKLCAEYNLDLNSVDNLVLHQANKLIVESIAKRMKLSMDKVPISTYNYGNTTSVSIPLTLVSARSKELSTMKQRNLVSAFGTGLSWATAYIETSNLVCPEVITYNHE